MLLCSIPAAAQEGSQAHDILLKTLALIQNPGGIQLDYHLRVTFYTKKGHIIFKGNKFRRESKKTIDWFDGTTFWTLNKSIRFGLIWATITLSNFKAANYDDSNFHFDPHKYPGVKIVDKR